MKSKIGVFGGSFDPVHVGHVESLLSAVKVLELDTVHVIPAYQSPGRPPIEGPSPEQRLAMAQLAFEGYEDKIKVDDLEIQRGGVSYTVETLKKMAQDFPEAEFYLIIGMDQYELFTQWKDYAEILSLAHLAVLVRPGFESPETVEDFPSGLQPWIEDFDGCEAILSTGKILYCLAEGPDIDVSASDVRRRLRLGQPIHDMVPMQVVDFIKQHGLYAVDGKKIGDFEAFTRFCAQVIAGKSGIQVLAYDLRDLQGPTEYTLLSSGTSTRHTTALSEHLVREVKKEFGVWPLSLEGQKEGRWIVVDYGSLIVHLFYDYVRQEYRLEELWKAGRRLDLGETIHR